MLFHIYVIFVVLFLFLITLPFFLLFEIVSLISKKALRVVIQPFVKGFMKILCFLIGVRITAEGLENVPDEPVLFVANHRSYFDPVIVYHSLSARHELGFIAKSGLTKVPLLSWWMRLLGCRFINRTDPKQGLHCIQECIAEVKDGYSIFIMPEGTRNHGEEMLAFMPGTLKVSERTGCPVVPVAIWKTDSLYEAHNNRFTHGKIRIRYGKPVAMKELSREERLALPGQLREEIGSMLTDLKKS